jgi:hypothetical protein
LDNYTHTHNLANVARSFKGKQNCIYEMNAILGCRRGSAGVGLVHEQHKCSIPEISLNNQTVPTNTLYRHITQRHLHYTAQGVIYCSNLLLDK